MTLREAKGAIEQQLAQFLSEPEVVVDVVGYNSKVYYVIIDLANLGQQLLRLPITGNETVLDALCQTTNSATFTGGLPAFASKHRMWIARPNPSESGCDQILPIDWHAITMAGSTKTNYQLLPGDRLYICADPLLELDGWLAKIISPIERVLGVSLLGSETVKSFQNLGRMTATTTGGG
jgi:hypothetical protein